MAKARAASAAVREDAATATGPTVATAAEKSAADRAERNLGRLVALGLPAVSVAAAIVTGVLSSIGPAILILASGVLLGCIALFWASVRTLTGEAPLPEDLEMLAARRHAVDAVAERKGTVLRALKDLEHEHAIGKIDAADYAELSSEYRGQAKALMREMDAEVAPLRAEAELLAHLHLKKKGLADAKPEDADAALYRGAAPDVAPVPEVAPAPIKEDAPPALRLDCSKCATSNEPDATFCKKCGTNLLPAKTEGTDVSA